MYKLATRIAVAMFLLGVTTAHADALFYNNVSTPQFGGAVAVGDELADDVPFTGSQTVTRFQLLYHADTAVNATFKFSGVNAANGGVGATVATFTATNLPAGDHLFAMNLTAAQRFVWTAAPKLRNLTTLSGGYFSARFTSATGTGSGGARWFVATNDSLDGYFNVTQGILITTSVDIPTSLYPAGVQPRGAGHTADVLRPAGQSSALHHGRYAARPGHAQPRRARRWRPDRPQRRQRRGPDTVIVPAGQTTAEFDVITAPVDVVTAAFAEATFNGVFRSVELILGPAQPPDTVAIQRAEYRASRRELRIEATSSNASATLTAFVTSSGQAIGTLGNIGGGQFRATLTFPVNPVNITVRSSSGGSASRAVTLR